jgi:peptidoglycan/xylan/chitin deacetylase (PgdA/CDA1 family)
MEIESHSLDHVDLAIQSPAALTSQLTESRRVIERELLHPVRYFCYPSGRYSPAVVAAARAAGYEAAVTVNYGLLQRESALFELPRVRIKDSDTVASLDAKMFVPDWKYARGRFGR